MHFARHGATPAKSVDNRFSEYFAVTFSRSVGCQECQKIFVLSGHFLILKKPKTAGD
jgi:hypothetical protein